MAMTRTQKTDHVDMVQTLIGTANTVYLVSLAGLTVNEVNGLRSTVREAGGGLRVIRNRLALRTLTDETEELRKHFAGPTAVAHHPEEPVVLAKVLQNFAKEHPALTIKGGFVERSQVVDQAGVKELSDLPGLDECRTMLACMIAAPATTLVRLLSTPGSQVARVVQARSEQEG